MHRERLTSTGEGVVFHSTGDSGILYDTISLH